ncbi:MAG: transaldolase family protein [Thermoplasmata archaeon]
MKIFVDTAKKEEIKEAESWGILDGVTTNPSLIKRAVESAGEDISLEEYLGEILRTVDGPVSLEVGATSQEGMISEAKVLYDKFNHINNNVVVKVPVNTAMELGDDNFSGIKVTKELSDQGIPVNSTLIMAPNQALMAAKAGAAYVSPFVGRIDDYIRKCIGLKKGADYPKGTYYPEELALRVWEQKLGAFIDRQDIDNIVYKDHQIMKLYDWANDDGLFSGIDMLWSVKQIYDSYDLETEIIAASIRTGRQVRLCAEMGVDIATIPFPVIEKMMIHTKTEEGMKSFCDDVIPEYQEILKG